MKRLFTFYIGFSTFAFSQYDIDDAKGMKNRTIKSAHLTKSAFMLVANLAFFWSWINLSPFSAAGWI